MCIGQDALLFLSQREWCRPYKCTLTTWVHGLEAILLVSLFHMVPKQIPNTFLLFFPFFETTFLYSRWTVFCFLFFLFFGKSTNTGTHLLIIHLKKKIMRKGKKINILIIFFIFYKNGIRTFLKWFINNYLNYTINMTFFFLIYRFQ